MHSRKPIIRAALSVAFAVGVVASTLAVFAPTAGGAHRASSMRPARHVGSTRARGTARAAATFTVKKDIDYVPPAPVDTPGHLLDLYIPTAGAGPFPVIIWQGGSAWRSNHTKDGADAMKLANEWADDGFAIAGVNTRDSDEVKFPGQVYDIKAAIRFLRSRATKFNLDRGRIGIMGNSSGGWTAAIAGTTAGVQSLEGTLGVTGLSSRVQAVVDLYGPTDFLEMEPHICKPNNGCVGPVGHHDDLHSNESDLMGCQLQLTLACRQKVETANPITYITKDDPPFVIMHGENDPLVPYHESLILWEAMRAACHNVRFWSLPNKEHEHSYLSDASQTADRIVQTSKGCNPPTWGNTPTATYDTLLTFFQNAMP